MNEPIERPYETATISGLQVTAPPEVMRALTGGHSETTLAVPRGSRIAIGVSLSRPTGNSLRADGYFLLAEIGQPRQMPPAEFPQTAERIAVLIIRITKFMKKENIYVALSCPTAVAFMIGSLLGTMRQFRVLHYDSAYTVIPDYSPERFKKSLKEEK